jgi:transketolase
VRRAFAGTLAELATRDRRILLLTGDLGYKALDPFFERHPDRFLNVGVAEQNMVGLATGLAEAGFLPFVYSIATFASLRAYEFIRNGPILQHLPVRIIGVGGGFEYGPAGPTHHGLEDIGVMRLQPGLTLIAPADHEQARNALLASWDLPGPVYYRLGKDDRATVPGLNGRFEIGRAQIIREGKDILMVTMGSIAAEAAAAAEDLYSMGITSGVMVVASVNPAPTDELAAKLAGFRAVMTVEAHYITGGLGSWVAEVIAERGLSCRLIRCGVKNLPDSLTGKQDYLQHRHGLSRDALVQTARQVLSA